MVKVRHYFNKFLRYFVFGFLSITLLFFCSFSCLADSKVADLDIYDFAPVPNTDLINLNKSHITYQNKQLTRIQSPSGNIGFGFLFNVSDFLVAGHNYTLNYGVRPSNNPFSVYIMFTNLISSDISDYNESNSLLVANYSTTHLTAGSLNYIDGTFTVNNSISQGRIYMIVMLSCGSNTATIDFTRLSIYDTDEFAGTWDKEQPPLTDIDTGGLINDFEDNGNTLITWLGDFKANSFVLQSIHGIGDLLSSFFGDLSRNVVPFYLALVFGGTLAVVTALFRNVGSFSDDSGGKK